METCSGGFCAVVSPGEAGIGAVCSPFSSQPTRGIGFSKRKLRSGELRGRDSQELWMPPKRSEWRLNAMESGWRDPMRASPR